MKSFWQPLQIRTVRETPDETPLIQVDDLECLVARILKPVRTGRHLEDPESQKPRADGPVGRAEFSIPSEAIERLVEALSRTHGTPQVSQVTVFNGMGVPYPKKTFIWNDAEKNVLVLESIAERISAGRLVFRAARFNT